MRSACCYYIIFNNFQSVALGPVRPATTPKEIKTENNIVLRVPASEFRDDNKPIEILILYDLVRYSFAYRNNRVRGNTTRFPCFITRRNVETFQNVGRQIVNTLS